MYRFYFNLPKNDQNAGTVFLPTKKHTMLPIVISCYACVAHWAKRLDEDLRDAVIKNNMGYVTMELPGDKTDPRETTCIRWENNLYDMLEWVKIKKFAHPNKIGLFAQGLPAVAADNLKHKIDTAAFSILNIPGHTADFTASIPTLYLQGTGEKIELLTTKKAPLVEVTRRENPENKSAELTFQTVDDYLYKASNQAAAEIVAWLNKLW